MFSFFKRKKKPVKEAQFENLSMENLLKDENPEQTKDELTLQLESLYLDNAAKESSLLATLLNQKKYSELYQHVTKKFGSTDEPDSLQTMWLNSINCDDEIAILLEDPTYYLKVGNEYKIKDSDANYLPPVLLIYLYRGLMKDIGSKLNSAIDDGQFKLDKHLVGSIGFGIDVAKYIPFASNRTPTIIFDLWDLCKITCIDFYITCGRISSLLDEDLEHLFRLVGAANHFSFGVDMKKGRLLSVLSQNKKYTQKYLLLLAGTWKTQTTFAQTISNMGKRKACDLLSPYVIPAREMLGNQMKGVSDCEMIGSMANGFRAEGYAPSSEFEKIYTKWLNQK